MPPSHDLLHFALNVSLSWSKPGGLRNLPIAVFAVLSLADGGFAEVAPEPPVLPTPHHARFQDATLDLGKGVEILVPARSSRLKEIAEILRQGLEENAVIGEVTPFVLAPDRSQGVLEKKGDVPESIPETPPAGAPSSSHRPSHGSVSISLSLAPLPPAPGQIPRPMRFGSEARLT